MKQRSFHLHDARSGAAITVHIALQSKRNEISSILADGTLEISLTASQNAEKSNKALIAFLSDVLGVKQEQIEIIAGFSGSNKLITIMDLDKASVQERILSYCS